MFGASFCGKLLLTQFLEPLELRLLSLLVFDCFAHGIFFSHIVDQARPSIRFFEKADSILLSQFMIIFRIGFRFPPCGRVLCVALDMVSNAYDMLESRTLLIIYVAQ